MRDNDFKALFDKAYAAGMAAGSGSSGGKAVGITDGTNHWTLSDYPCGFAWVTVPGNSAFGRWGKKSGLFTKAYPTGVWYWVGEFNQSMTRKEAFAHAFANVLKEAGVDARPGSRID